MAGPGFGLPPTRKTQFFLGLESQRFAENLFKQGSLEALYQFGEYTMFVLMWNALDNAAGLVGRCPICTTQENRAFAAYKQPTRYRCPECFGTTYEGGFRAKVIRPAIWSDTNAEINATSRGVVKMDSVQIETTADLTIHHGDYALRINGQRYQMDEVSPIIPRDSFGHPDDDRSLASLVHAARRDDPVGSVSYTIPPTDPATLKAVLTPPHGRIPRPGDFAQHEVIRGPLVQ